MAGGDNTEPVDREELEGHEVAPGQALTSADRDEIDMQVATARKYPRSPGRFKKMLLERATLDEETAQSMFYILPRGGKRIEGETIRFAEIAASCYGNLRIASRITAEERTVVKAAAVCWDLEANVQYAIEVPRRVTTRDGVRYDEDMLNVTKLAASAIARRNAILSVVPRALLREAYLAAKQVALGKGLSQEMRRQKAIEVYAKGGITQEQVLRLVTRLRDQPAVECRTLDDITTDDLINLRGVITAIQVEGIYTYSDLQRELAQEPAEAAAPGVGSALDRMTERMRAAKQPTPAPPPSAPAEAPAAAPPPPAPAAAEADLAERLALFKAMEPALGQLGPEQQRQWLDICQITSLSALETVPLEALRTAKARLEELAKAAEKPKPPRKP